MVDDKDIDVFDLQTYQFDLPQEYIAQYPVEPRDSSRLLVLNRSNSQLEDKVFSDIIEYLESGDTLVLNDSRVIPARLFGYKESGARVEILLLKKIAKHWEALVRPAKRLKTGSIIKFDSQSEEIEAEIIEELDIAGGRLLLFKNCPDEDSFFNEIGHIPLPPYINRADIREDQDNYQTVYARENGSVAAPTAGLHFTRGLLEEIEKKGINIATVLLHVGLGTFRPVNSPDIRRHNMHYEYYQLEEDTAALLNSTRQQGKRIIAVGTTVVRTLETVYNEDYGFVAGKGETNSFIYPGYKFEAVDSLISNFHLPASSLIMLVSAFAGINNTMAAYRHAIEKNYRFFSYGDAMLII